jgi:hypothetical protein
MGEPFTITVKHWDEPISISKDHSDITFDDFMEMVRQIAVAIYSEKLFVDYFIEQSDGKRPK